MMNEQVRKKVEAFIGEIKQIPTLPDIYLKVKQAFEDPSLTFEYLADAIRYDQAITIAILRLANSPFFGFRKKISSINQAIMLIGLREVYSLVLSVLIMGLFPIKPTESDAYFPARKFWEHSLGVAIMARALAKTMGHPYPEELFVAGLIHDVGKLIEKIYLGDQFIRICRRARDEERFFMDIEMEELGFTHAEVGQVLTEVWRFPTLLMTTTAMHHNPDGVVDPQAAESVSVVQAADSIVRGLGLGWDGDPFVTPLSVDTLNRLHLIPFGDLGVIITRVKKEFNAAVAALMTNMLY